MHVVLAYPYGDHSPDETVDLPADVAKSLIRSGRARHPDHDSLEDESVTELRAYARNHGIDLGGAKRKAEIVAAITAAENQEV